ncbi:MAG: sodium:solute symporter [Clostridia bacterium]|nr:sodium:solute symporter [Clostridia bacterium]
MTAKIFTAILIVCFFSLMIAVGIYTRKNATNVDGFVLGGRSVGPWLTAFAFGTSYFSAVIFVGYAGQFGWNFGLASTWIGLGNAFIGSLLAWNILGRRTRVMTQHLNSKTMPDFFEKRFGSKGLKIAASIIVFIFLIPYTASLYNGLSSLFGIAFAIPYWVCILAMAILTGIYVIFGGYMATAINDFIQGIIMLGGIVAVVLAVLNQNDGLMGSVEALATSENGGWAYTSFLGPNPISLLVVVLLTSLGTWGLPQMIGKFYAISNEAAIRKGTLISTVFAIIVAGGCYFLGGFGRIFVSPEQVAEKGFDSIVPTMLAELSPYIIGVVIVLVLSASMSTLSSLVLTSASTLALDVIVPASKKKLGEKKKIFILRLLIVFFILLSAVIAILKDSVWKDFVFIAQMMGISWGALAGAFLAPFMYGLYWKKTTRTAVWVSFIFGVGLMLTQLLISLDVINISNAVFDVVFANSLYSGVFAMIGGLILVPVVSLLTAKNKPENTEEIFACYDTEITVRASKSLQEK